MWPRTFQQKFYSYAAKKMLQASQIFLHRSTLFHCVSVRLSISDRLQCWLARKDLCWKRLLQTQKLISFGTTDLNFTLCLNKEYDDKGQQKGDCFVVESLRDEDCFSKSRTAYTVTHIFQRRMMRKNIQIYCFR